MFGMASVLPHKNGRQLWNMLKALKQLVPASSNLQRVKMTTTRCSGWYLEMTSLRTPITGNGGEWLLELTQIFGESIPLITRIL